MNEDLLVLIVSIFLTIGIVSTIIYQRWGKYFPKSAFVGFSSIKEIVYYYKSAISVIAKKRWLLWLPLCFVLSNYLIKIPVWIIQRSSFISSGITTSDQTKPYTEPFLERFITSLSQSASMLDYGYYGAIAGNIFFQLIFIVCAFILVFNFRDSASKFQKYVLEHNIDKFIFLKKVFKYSLFVLFFLICPIMIFEITIKNPEIPPFVLIGPGFFVLGLLSISLLSLIEGIVLFALKSIIDGTEFDPKILINKTLEILKPLFYINLILGLFASLPSLVMYPYTISTVFSHGYGMPITFHYISSIFKYSNIVIVIFTVCTPFVLINKGSGTIKDVFLLNFKFIRNNLFKYLQFICIAILLMFSPSFLSLILNTLAGLSSSIVSSGMVFDTFSYSLLIIDMAVATLISLIAVPIYIALFIFFKSKIIIGDVVC